MSQDNLKDFIQNNRESFDPLEPKDELWKGIEDRLPSQNTTSIFHLRTWMSAAAVVTVLALGYWVLQFNDKTGTLPTADELIIPELNEMEAFYSMQVSAKLEELKLFGNLYYEVEPEFKYDIEELDAAYKELKKDLKDDIYNEEVIEAMIQNYRMRLEILEQIQEQLQKVKTPVKNEANETVRNI